MSKKMTRNRRKMIEQTGDSLLLSKHSIQLLALFLLLSVICRPGKLKFWISWSPKPWIWLRFASKEIKFSTFLSCIWWQTLILYTAWVYFFLSDCALEMFLTLCEQGTRREVLWWKQCYVYSVSITVFSSNRENTVTMAG